MGISIRRFVLHVLAAIVSCSLGARFGACDDVPVAPDPTIEAPGDPVPGNPVPAEAAGLAEDEAQAADPKVAAAEAPGAAVFARFVRESRENPRFVGAWVDVDVAPAVAGAPNGVPSYTLRPWLDADEKVLAVQRAELEKVVLALVKEGRLREGGYRIDEPRLRPVRALVSELNEDDVTAEGLICEAYFAPAATEFVDADSGRVRLVLRGRIETDEQATAVLVKGTERLATAAWTFEKGESVTPASELKVLNSAQLAAGVSAEFGLAFAGDPELHGAWMEVRVRYADDDCDGSRPTFVCRPLLDEARLESQRAAVERLAADLAGDRRLEVGKPEPVPFSRLLADVQKAIEGRPELTKCRVCDGYFEPAGEARFLVLAGRVSRDEEQVETILSSIVPKVLEGYPAFAGVIPKTKSEFKVVSPSAVGSAVWQRVTTALMENEALRGAWVGLDVDFAPDDCDGTAPRFLFTPAYDGVAAIGERQRAAFTALVDELVEEGLIAQGGYRVEDRNPWGVSRFLDDVQAALVEDRSFRNCFVDGAFCEPAEPVLRDDGRNAASMVLLGRVPSEAMKEAVVARANELLRQSRVTATESPLPGRLTFVSQPNTGKVAPPGVSDVEGRGLRVIDPSSFEVVPRKYVRRAVCDVEALRGAWVEVQAVFSREDLDGTRPTIVYRALLDEDRKVGQQAALENLAARIAKVEGHEFSIDEPIVRPVDRIVDRLQDRLEQNDELVGAIVLGGCFGLLGEPADASHAAVAAPVLNLAGRIRTERQRQLVIDEYERLREELALSPVPAEHLFEVSTEGLQIGGTEGHAAWFFNNGREFFRHGRFEDAHRAFRQANADATSPVYLYWMALCEIQMEAEDRATAHVATAMRRVGAGFGNRQRVLQSLEPVQFGLRRRLTAIEAGVRAGENSH
jgi:hypothetical protein